MTVTAATPPVRDLGFGSTRRAGVVAAVGCTAAATIFLPVIAGLVRQWYEDPNATYGSLVVIAVVVATRQRWQRLRDAPLHGSWWGGAALAAAAALYAAATLAADVFLLRASCVVFGAAAVWFVCGAACLRVLAAPLALCVAAIPPPAALVTELTMPLQLAASSLAALLLGLLGVDVVRDGNILTLSYITLEVAEACSGMRSIVTLLALVGVYGATSGAAVGRVLVLAAATLPVAIAGNGLRVAGTAMLAAGLGESATRGLAHEMTGFATFAVMCVALATVHRGAARVVRSRSVA